MRPEIGPAPVKNETLNHTNPMTNHHSESFNQGWDRTLHPTPDDFQQQHWHILCEVTLQIKVPMTLLHQQGTTTVERNQFVAQK
mmetsp:Transcript_36725/g.78249  ORF Transcript_36725/g.78249 Transcript_36725/m.78249 type:complete len:84 (+) Transcript_36725:309-560(+)